MKKMGRISTAVIVAVSLLPTVSAAQTLQPLNAPTPPRDVFLASPSTYAPTYDRLPSTAFPQSYNAGGGYYPSGWRYYTPSREVSPMSRYMARGMNVGGVNSYLRTYEPGRLRLDVVPSQARVYVDGSFIGTVDDVNWRGGGYAVTPGPHHVSVRARGYEVSSASLWVPSGQSVLYRDYLDRTQPQVRYRSPFLPVSYYPQRPYRPVLRYVYVDVNPASSSQGMYVIPGCFAGDAPPRPEKLLPGCKLENLRRVYH